MKAVHERAASTITIRQENKSIPWTLVAVAASAFLGMGLCVVVNALARVFKV